MQCICIMGLNKCKCSPNQRNKQAYQTDNVTKRQIKQILAYFPIPLLLRLHIPPFVLRSSSVRPSLTKRRHNEKALPRLLPRREGSNMHRLIKRSGTCNESLLIDNTNCRVCKSLQFDTNNTICMMIIVETGRPIQIARQRRTIYEIGN